MGFPAPMETASGRAFPAMARHLFGDVRLEFPHGKQESSRLKSALLGPCRLTRLQAETHTVFGDRVTRGSENPDSIKLIIQTKGKSVLSQNGRTAAVGESGVVIYDPTRPYVLTNRTAVQLLLLQIPRSVLHPAAVARLTEPFAVSPDNAGVQRVLLSIMDSALSEIGDMEDAARASIGQTMIDLVRTMTGTAGDGQNIAHRSLDILLRRIKDYVAENIDRPTLCVSEIAARMGCSVRYVHRAFEHEETTPADYIWTLRVEKAARLLRSEPNRPGGITDIAFSLGFSSSAHFSRAFRSRYRITPSQWRDMSLT